MIPNTGSDRFRRVLLLSVAAFVCLGADPGSGQNAEPRVRLAAVATVPEPPAFGEEFQLHLTLRAPVERMVILADTLIPSASVSGIGRGSWRTATADADSVDIFATYPVIAYQSGPQVLPSLEVRFGDRSMSAAARASGAAGSSSAAIETLEPVVLTLGAVQVEAYSPMESADSALLPRPAADVLGGDWSVWLILAVGLAVAALFGTVGVLGYRWWKGTGAAVLSRWRAPSARTATLKDLDRILASGWHRNGRVDEFYASSTGALRRFAGQIEAEWVPGLTSGELISHLEKRWGRARVDELRPVVEIAERVKFGSHRPSPEDAEKHWSVIRDWVRNCPEP